MSINRKLSDCRAQGERTEGHLHPPSADTRRNEQMSLISLPPGYTIPAIPTRYRGRLYRSRLEARWAAFFDLLGWKFEYEPIDLGSWSPDFLLSDWNCLVEVKPHIEFHQETWDKCIDACEKAGLFVYDEDGVPQAIWLTALAPRPFYPRNSLRQAVEVGWFTAKMYSHPIKSIEPYKATLLWQPNWSSPSLTAELAYLDPNDGWWSLNDASRDGPNPRFLYPDYAMQLWARATNSTQWRGTEVEP